MEEIMRVLRAMQEDITTQRKDMKEMEENIKISINNNIDDKFSRIEQRTDQLEKKIEQQQKTIDFLDRKLRKKNLLFFGVGETEKKLRTVTEHGIDHNEYTDGSSMPQVGN